MLLRTRKRIALGKLIALGSGLLCVFFSYGGKDIFEQSPPQRTLYLLDLSPSMNTQDMPWELSRLAYAQQLIENYVGKNPLHEHGLLLTTSYHEVSYFIPPTTDTDSFLHKLWLIHTRTLGDYTQPADKWEAFIQALAWISSGSTPTTLIIISDMDTTERSPSLSKASSGFPKNIHVIALWTTIPSALKDANGDLLGSQTVGRNDARWHRLATTLNATYEVNPSQISVNPTTYSSLPDSNILLRIGVFLISLGI